MRKCADLSSYLLASRDIVPGIATYVMWETRRGDRLILPHLLESIQTEPRASTYPSTRRLNTPLHSLLRLSLSLSSVNVGVDYGGGAKLKTE